jgi:mRNA interferase MazF
VDIRVNRGEIWWADLEQPGGSEPGYPRPIVILQVNFLNHSFLNTVVAVGLTSSLGKASLSGNVLLPKRKTGLPRDSVAHGTQIMTIDKEALRQKAGSLDPDLLRRVSEGVKLVLGL